MERKSGILLPIFSLPSEYGIGTLGSAAFGFVDFLRRAGQSVWQMLPVGPPSVGDSPYSSFSSHAGNPFYIDLELLFEDGLLEKSELGDPISGAAARYIDYDRLRNSRLLTLRLAFRRGRGRDDAARRDFERENAHWLPDYALFMALKLHFGGVEWAQWPDEGLRRRRAESLAQYRELLAEDVEFFTYIQYLFYSQWERLRAYANANGVALIGDLPIYVAHDSADIWAEPENFMLDAEGLPLAVSGVPPDAFSEAGQIWNNPLYDWQRMEKDGYSWWLRRIGSATKLFDGMRIDHFRGFESYWSVPAEATDARGGKWLPGPGMDFIGVMKERFPDTFFIAEDLGYETPEVERLLRDSGFPGMKVLLFAFDPDEPSDHLPHLHRENSVCYVGTHDNETATGWAQSAAPENLAHARRYLGAEGDMRHVLIRAGMASPATLFVAQIQDYLGLGSEGRVNVPGTEGGNWRWRLLPGEADTALADEIKSLAMLYERCGDAHEKRARILREKQRRHRERGY